MDYNFEKHSKEERIFLKNIHESIKKNKEFSSEYLDQSQSEMVKSFLNKIKITHNIYDFNQLFDKKIITVNIDYPNNIICLKIIPKIKNKLKHKDYMGAIYNLGLSESKLGDIIVMDDCGYLFTIKFIEEYIKNNLLYVGNSEVVIETVEEKNIEFQKQHNIKKIFTSSLRIDTIVSKTFNLSREESSKKITKKEVLINDILTTNKNKELKIKDNITVKKLGKFIIEDYNINQKNKYVITIKIYS